MCEFKLKMLENDNEKEISENILYSTIEDDKLIFRNILGMTTSVENAMIIEISVLSEKILLLKSDLMPYVYKLIQLQNSGASDQDIKDAWIKLKEMGDKLFIK